MKVKRAKGLIEERASRAVQRAMIGRWLRRLRVAQGLWWLVSIEVEALATVQGWLELLWSGVWSELWKTCL